MTASVRGEPGGRTWQWVLAVLLATASFLVLFDSLATATALPSIGREFGLPPGRLQWVVSFYSLSIGAFLALGGRVCDRWGRRRVLVASLALCTVAGLFTGLAPDLPVLLVGRVLQGLAAAFAIPAALATAATVYPDEPWRGRVYSVISSASWSAGLAGATLGGLITVHLGWRWIFLVTVPAAALALVAGFALLPHDTPRRDVRVDVWGAMLACGGLGALLWGLGQLGSGGHIASSLLAISAGALLLGVLVVVERRVATPLVPPRLVRTRRMLGGCLAFGAYCAGYTAVIVVGSLYLQDVHGLSAAAAGVALSPVLVGGIISSVLSGPVLSRFAARSTVAACLLLCAVSLTVIALLGTGSIVTLLPWLVLWGLCSGPVYVRLTQECIGTVGEGDHGTASALFESMSHVGGGVASAVYLTLLSAGWGYPHTELVAVAVVALGAVVALVVLPRSGRRRPTDSTQRSASGVAG